MKRISRIAIVSMFVLWLVVFVALIPRNTRIQRIEATATMLARPFITPGIP